MRRCTINHHTGVKQGLGLIHIYVFTRIRVKRKQKRDSEIEQSRRQITTQDDTTNSTYTTRWPHSSTIAGRAGNANIGWLLLLLVVLWWFVSKVNAILKMAASVEPMTLFWCGDWVVYVVILRRSITAYFIDI